jgi:hypothetical protein
MTSHMGDDSHARHRKRADSADPRALKELMVRAVDAGRSDIKGIFPAPRPNMDHEQSTLCR